jgi:NADPH2:quinone reductase
LEQFGAPDVLKEVSTDLPPLGPGELRLRHTAVGVNYHDVYVRSGLYQTLPLPGVPGIEAVGVVEETGPGVSHISVGDRIGYVTGRYGAYAERRNLDAGLAIPLPPQLSDVQAAASLMKALTVCMLIRRLYMVKSGNKILVHAAAGGIGQLLCRWASHLGAVVIGTVGNVEKAATAKAAGATHCILYRQEDIAARVMDITDGEGVAAVYDSVGADTFEASLASLAFEGHLICFGQSSGPVPPFSLSTLASRSLTVSRPIIFHYLRTPDRLRALTEEALSAFTSGIMPAIDPIVLPLGEAAEAHRLLEARQSPGGIVLTP